MSSSTQRLPHLTPEQIRRRRRLSVEILWVCTIALVPWAIYLGLSLPRDYKAKHWDLAWAGFDGLEILALGATAYFGWRRRQALIASALAAATLLICDAWFDIALDLGTPDIWTSVGSAVFLELPLAFFLIHRVRLLLRISLLQLFPETDERGRPFKLSTLPLLASYSGPLARPRADRNEQAENTENENKDQSSGESREPGAD